VKQILLICLAWFGTVELCRAAAYDDFAQGVSANIVDDSDRAIASFTAAIEASDLSKALLPAAYRGRGEAYLHKQKCDLALADLDSSLKLKPDDLTAVELHADAAICLEKFDVALAEMSTLNGKADPEIYWERARLHFTTGNYRAAADDLISYVGRRPKYAYGVLWLEMARLRGGMLDPKVAMRDIDDFDSDDWPAPLLALYAGKAKVEDISAAVARGAADSRVGRECEANYYVAEWHLAYADAASARPLLQDAATHCPPRFIEARQARYELRNLP